MLAIIFAVTGVLLAAISRVIEKFVIRGPADLPAVLIYIQLGAGVVLILISGLPGILDLAFIDYALLILSGLFWAVGVWLDLHSLEHLDVGVSAIIGAARYIFLMLAGLLIFGSSLLY